MCRLCDEVIVVARSEDGIGLYLASSTGDGVSVEPGDGIDGSRRLGAVGVGSC